MIIWSIIALILAVFLATEFYNFRTGVPTVASFPSARRAVGKAIQLYARKENSHILDLGSGNGQLARHIARTFPAARITGLEISIAPWLFSTLMQKIIGPRNARFIRTDFWRYDCAEIDIIITYLTENIMERVSQKLRQELKAGAMIFANDTPLQGDWQPIDIIDIGLFNMKIYVYRQAAN